MKSTLVPLTLLILFALIGFMIPFLIKTKVAIPRPLSIHEVDVQNGNRPAGKFGLKILEEITRKPHPFNSLENLKVRAILVKYLEGIIKDFENQWGCTQSSPFNLLLEDPVNLKSGHMFYESSNLILVIKGASNQSLLVSSHYDSASVSHGATDAGLAIGSMVSAVYSIARRACFGLLTHSIVFNFNNGEEIELLGGEAFTYHHLFANVKAFINLEGTGVSEGYGSSIFRTNSYDLVSLVTKSSPFPSSSILANNAMRFLNSGTDYQFYAKYVPGIDVAFYSYRYLYHTQKDDMLHTSAQSLQHMADNLLSSIIYIVNSTFLDNLYLENEFKNASVEAPPIPSFVFFDRMGIFGVTETQFTFLASITVFLCVIGAITVIRFGMVIFSSSNIPIYRHYVRPSFNSILLVFFTFFSTLIIAFIFALVKQFINPNAVYGHPEISIASTAFLVLASLCLCQLMWLRISILLDLSDRLAVLENGYDSLPTSEPPNFSGDSDGDSDGPAAEAEEIGYDGERPPSAVADIEHADIATDNSSNFSATRNPHIREKSRVFSAWFPVGILAFWSCWLALSLILSLKGYSVLYFVNDLALFSIVNLILTEFMEYYYRKLLHEDLFVNPTYFQRRFVIFYEDYYWIVQVILSTVVPFVFISDILHSLIVSTPSLIGEGLPSIVIDMLFTFMILVALLGTIPVLAVSERSKCFIIFSILSLCFWTPQLFIFPYSPDRPFKYQFHESWNLSGNFSTSKIYTMPRNDGREWFKKMNFPNEVLIASDRVKWYGSAATIVLNETATTNTSDLISLQILKHTMSNIKGIVTGSAGSRVCQLELLGEFGRFDVQYSVEWRGEDTESQRNPVIVMKRGFDTSDGRIKINFELKDFNPSLVLRVTCYLPLGNRSHVYNQFLAFKPEWAVCDGEGDLGGLEFQKLKIDTQYTINIVLEESLPPAEPSSYDQSFLAANAEETMETNFMVDTSIDEFFFAHRNIATSSNLKREILIKAEELHRICDLLVLQRETFITITSVRLIQRIIMDFDDIIDDIKSEEIIASLDSMLSKARQLFEAVHRSNDVMVNCLLKGVYGFDSFSCSKFASMNGKFNSFQRYGLKIRNFTTPGQMHSMETLSLTLKNVQDLLKSLGYQFKLIICNKFSFCSYLNLVLVDQSNLTELVLEKVLLEILQILEAQGYVTNFKEVFTTRYLALLKLDSYGSIIMDVKISTVAQSEFALFWYKTLPFAIRDVAEHFRRNYDLVLTPSGLFKKSDGICVSETYIHLLYTI